MYSAQRLERDGSSESAETQLLSPELEDVLPPELLLRVVAPPAMRPEASVRLTHGDAPSEFEEPLIELFVPVFAQRTVRCFSGNDNAMAM